MGKRKSNISSSPLSWSGLFDHPREVRFFSSLDGVILGVTCVLALSGLIAVFSASGYMANVRFDVSTTFFLQRQGIWLGIGFILLFLVARLDYTLLRPYIPHLLCGCLVLLALVLVVGSDNNGARRWFNFAWFSVQPSELTKLAVVLYLASYFGKPDLSITAFRHGFLPPLLVVGLVCLLLIVEDFGTPAVLGLILVGMLFLAGARYLHLASLVLVVTPIAIGVITKSRERLERITSFLHPEMDPQGAGHQLKQSVLALENGGIFGQGLAQGNQKLMFLPEGHTDFVLALIGEELGFVGTTCLLGLFVILILKGFRVSAQAPDLFGRYLALGITLLFGVQVLMNAGVVSGLLPTKGLTLPLVSYGGSSLVTSMVAIGLLLSVARRRGVTIQELH